MVKRPTNGWDLLESLGHPCKFQRVLHLGSITARTLVVGVSQTLRRWTEGASYIRQGDHHVGHWPTFLVVSVLHNWKSLPVPGSSPKLHVHFCRIMQPSECHMPCRLSEDEHEEPLLCFSTCFGLSVTLKSGYTVHQSPALWRHV